MRSTLGALAFFLLATLAASAARGQTIIEIGSGFKQPQNLAVDSAGNVFVADRMAAGPTEILAASNHVAVGPLRPGFAGTYGMAFDANGNIFVTNGTGVQEFTAASAYTNGGLHGSTGVAVESE